MSEDIYFKRGDLVAVRYRSCGTFGGMEIDWKAGIYIEPYEGSYCGNLNMHKVLFLPTSVSFDSNPSIIDEEDIKPVDYIWKSLKGYRLENAEIS